MNQLNRSFLYLFPILYSYLIEELKLDYNLFSEKITAILDNTYIKYKDKDCIVLSLLKTDDSALLLEEFKRSNLFVDCIESDSINIIFNIPKQMEDVFYKFKNGKYSKYNESDKELLLEFCYSHLNRLYDRISSVLYRDKNLIEDIKKHLGLNYFKEDWELTSIMNEELETYG